MRILVAALALVAAASATAGCGSPPYIDPPNPLLGKITDVTGETFVVTDTLGGRWQFRNANPLDTGMGQQHMQQHRFDAVPVKVTWRRDGYELVAVKIEDGSGSVFTTPTPTPTFSFPTPSSFPFPLPSRTSPTTQPT